MTSLRYPDAIAEELERRVTPDIGEAYLPPKEIIRVQMM